MQPWFWRAGALGALAVLVWSGSGLLAAQSGRQKPGPRARRAQAPRISAQSYLTPQTLSAKMSRLQTQALSGTVLLFEYDVDNAVELDLDDNDSYDDAGDRVILQGTLWQSDRRAARLRRLGRVASVYDYLDPSGEATGTDLTQTVDMYFAGSGQIRAGGFWNVDDGIGDPALSVNGATGASATRQYARGQLILLGKVDDTKELFFLAR